MNSVAKAANFLTVVPLNLDKMPTIVQGTYSFTAQDVSAKVMANGLASSLAQKEANIVIKDRINGRP